MNSLFHQKSAKIPIEDAIPIGKQINYIYSKNLKKNFKYHSLLSVWIQNEMNFFLVKLIKNHLIKTQYLNRVLQQNCDYLLLFSQIAYFCEWIKFYIYYIVSEKLHSGFFEQRACLHFRLEAINPPFQHHCKTIFKRSQN